MYDAQLRTVAFNADRPAVQSTVMGRANGDQVVGAVLAAFGAKSNVVNVEVDGVAAAGDSATLMIAMQYAASQGRRNRLPGAPAHVGGRRLIASRLGRLRE